MMDSTWRAPGLKMAPTRPKARNYRRKRASSSSPDGSDLDLQHSTTPPPPGLSPLLVHLTSTSADLRADNNSLATLERVTSAGGEGRERKAGDRRSEGESCEEESFSGREADREASRGASGFPNGGLDSPGPPTGRGVSKTGAKRIGSGVGYNMLKSMGWRENTGLGQSRNGIVDPILPTPKPNHLGIGFNPTAAHDVAQEDIRKIQMAKAEERDRKLQQKLEKAETAEEEAVFMRESFVAAPSIPYEHLSGWDAGQQGTSSRAAGSTATDPGQCPYCKQRFDTKHGLKSHINARHARLLLAAKRQLKNKKQKRPRREGGSKSVTSGRRQSARSLAPLSQDFSIYD